MSAHEVAAWTFCIMIVCWALVVLVAWWTDPGHRRRRKMNKHKSSSEYSIPEGYTLADLRALVARTESAPGDARVKVVAKFNGDLKTVKIESKGNG